MAISILVLSIILIILSGFFVVDIFINKNNLLERISLGFLVGINIFTILLFLFNWKFSIAYKLNNSLIILLGFFLLSLLLNLIIKKINGTNGWNLCINIHLRKLTLLEKIIIGVLAFLIMSVVLSNFYWPVMDWDALAVYDFKAISFATTGYMQDAINRGYFTTYPFFGSLSHTFIYLTGVKNPMFFYSLLYISVLTVFYFLLRKITGRFGSLVGVLALACNPLIFAHASMAYQNLPYTIYFALGIIYLCLGLKDKKINYILLGSLVFGLSNWVRVEFFLFYYLVVGLYFLKCVITKKVDKKILFSIVFSCIFVYLLRSFWQGLISEVYNTNVANIEMSLVNYIHTFLTVPKIEHLLSLFKYIIKGFSLTFSFLPILYLVVLFYLFVRERKFLVDNLEIITLPLLGMFFVVFGSYIFSLSYPGWTTILESFYRLIMVFLPTYIFVMINVASNLTNSFKYKKNQ